MMRPSRMHYRTNLHLKRQEIEDDLEILVTFDAHPGVKASFDSPAEEPTVDILDVSVLEEGSNTKVVEGPAPDWLVDMARKSAHLTESLIEHAFEVWVAVEDARADAAMQRAGVA